jgi:molybdopterin molybdotransferase
MKSRRLLDDCFLHDAERLRHEDALALIRERVSCVAKVEPVPLAQASGRILAEEIKAPRDVPGFTNAAVDGYAFAHASLVSGRTRLRVVARAAAGEAEAAALQPGEALRIFTGAVMPEGADTCIMQEDVEVEGHDIIVPKGIKPFANRRMAGEDMKAGERIVAGGQRLRPQDVAALASAGVEAVRCFAPLQVGLISTGHEIVRPGTALKPSQVYDSNHFMLRALLQRTGAQILDFGIIEDERAAVDAAIAEAAGHCDLVFSTGGASRGEADHVIKAVQAKGVLYGWQLAVKPGRPLGIGQIDDTVFLALPGNPVAVFVTFLLYGLPVLGQLQGMNWRVPQRYGVKAGFSFAKKKQGRREFWRGWIEETAQGPRLKKFARDGSGLISGLRQAMGLIEVLEDITQVREGDVLNYIPFTEFGIDPP